MPLTQYHLLKTRRFLPLFVTQFLNALNDNVFKNAFVILITFKIEQSLSEEQFLIALIGAVFILPFFLFSTTAGQLADKYEKSRLIRYIKFAEIIFMIIASVGFYANHISLLMITLFCLGMHSTFFGPIKYSILPDHLAKDELIGANALIEAGTFVAILLGQIIGGVLILSSNGIPVISIGLLTIALAGWISSLYIPPTRPASPKLKMSFNIIKETWHIIAFSYRDKIIFLSIIAISWFWFIGATIITQLPLFIKNNLYASAPVFTLFLIIFSLGIGVGSLLCNKLLKGKISAKYVPLCIFGMSCFMTDIFFASKEIAPLGGPLLSLSAFLKSFQNLRILIDIFALTVCAGLYVVPLYALIQECSDERLRSRIFASNNIIGAFFMVCSALFIMGLTAYGFTIPQLFLIMAIMNLFIVAYTLRLRPKKPSIP